MSSSHLLLGDTSANSMTAGWDAQTPLAGWLILHKDTQAPFIFTYLFHHAFQGPNCPRWTLQSAEGPDGGT